MRKPRDERAGFHHVVTRGNNKQAIFLDDRDRRVFMLLLDRAATRHNWQILCHALMRNHYHFVLRVLEGGLARGMRDLNGVYALYFNGEHGRTNHLFGRRYWSELTETDEHLRNAIRYVVQNPRRAGVPGPLASHPWTSYAASIGKGFGPSRFARDELLRLFGPTPATAVPAFIAFCEEPAPPRQVPGGPGECQVPPQNARVRVT